jgi:DNA-binding response OmpR family regulator
MNTTPISILLYGREPHLLTTSQWTLQSRGYQVVTMTDLDEIDSIPATPPIDLLVLGNMLTPKECANAVAKATARWPGIKRLSLTHDVTSAPARILGSQRMHPRDVPVRLLSMVGDLVGYAGSTSHSHIY